MFLGVVSEVISDIGIKLSLMYNSAKIVSENIAKLIVYRVLGWEGNIAGLIVALISSVVIGIVILTYMVGAAKDAAGNDTSALSQIDRIMNIAYIALFFAAFVGFVIAARYILDIISGGNGKGTM